MSIIMPAHGQAHTLGEVLEALSQQTIPTADFEVIVVVDGPSPSIEEVLQRAKMPYVLRWFVRPHRGETWARNYGLQQAAGELIVSMDDDTVPVREFLELHAAEHALADDVVVIGGLKDHPQSPEMFLVNTVGWIRGWHEQLSSAGFQPSHLHVPDGNFSIRRERLQQIGGWQEDVEGGYGGMDDAELGYRLVQAGLKLKACPAALVYHRYCKTMAVLLEHTRIVGWAQVQYAQRHPERLSDLVMLRFVTGPLWLRAIVRGTRLLPGWAFRGFRSQIAARLKTADWPVNRVTARLMRFLWLLYLCRGFWDHPAASSVLKRLCRLGRETEASAARAAARP